jgi:hypothetical protein
LLPHRAVAVVASATTFAALVATVARIAIVASICNNDSFVIREGYNHVVHTILLEKLSLWVLIG